MLKLRDKLERNDAIICIIGLGYVGLPLAREFSTVLDVIGYDIDTQKIDKLSMGNDDIHFTTNPKDIAKADLVIITVPTPVTRSKQPDLSYIKKACAIVAKNLRKNTVVILESTVYPGVTEEIVKPILDKSGLKYGEEFYLAYSPERINPGDEKHTIKTITKVVGGMNEEVTNLVANLYRKICNNVHKTKDIKTAEAAKVIENIQRDLNIALMNELSLIFDKMGLDTRAVIKAASTKWNFHPYKPGLVGGHCIPIDPYYLVYKAKELGYHPQVILAGRSVNDHMPKHVAEIAIKALNDAGKVIKDSKILLMGLTYKENVSDTRKSPTREIIKELKEFDCKIYGYDPLLSKKEIEGFGVNSLNSLDSLHKNDKMDSIIITVAHDAFKPITLDKLKNIMNEKPVLIDVRNLFNKKEAEEKGFYYREL